jgi:hypothetical protein
VRAVGRKNRVKSKDNAEALRAQRFAEKREERGEKAPASEGGRYRD